MCYFNGTLFLPRGGQVMKLDLKNGNQYSRFTGTQVPSNSLRTDGSKDVATFADARSCITDSKGFVYVTDINTSPPHFVRKVDPFGNVTTFLNSNLKPISLGFDINSNLLIVDDFANTIAKRVDGTSYTVIRNDLSTPLSVVADLLGNLFHIDAYANSLNWITGNIIHSLAGKRDPNGGYVDGLGTTARFSFPTSLAFDSKGRLFITDFDNQAIRMVTWL
jgi:hypothetical protein